MIYINEHTGEAFASAAECQKSEQIYLEEKRKAEEKARLDKAKREAERKKKEEEENAKREQIKEAYKAAIQATDNATKKIDEYLVLCDKLGYHVDGNFDINPLLRLIFEL